MKKMLVFLLAFLLPILSAMPAAAENKLPDEVIWNRWYQDERARLTVGIVTPMEGRFFTNLWGGTASDMDAQMLLHAASPVRWDGELDRFVFDRSVLEDAVVLTNSDGSRTYLMVLSEDLRWSDGTRITAADYAFSFLLQMDPAVAETGGRPGDFSWLEGSDAYLSGQAKALSGVRLIGDNILQVTAKAEALPYYYELNRLAVQPYPIEVIAPGTAVRDEGEGVYLSRPLTARTLEQTVLNETTGYLFHPQKVSGPYLLKSFDGNTALFIANPYFRGTEDGYTPRIGRITFTAEHNSEMVSGLTKGETGLLNKVTGADAIRDGIRCVMASQDTLAMQVRPRTGLTMIWFMECSPKVQEKAVREAIACCFDRDTFTHLYTGGYGTRTDGFFGAGQWMYRMAAGMDAGDVHTLPEKGLTLPGLTRYTQDREKAVRLLDAAGWTLNEKGETYNPYRDSVRYKRNGDSFTGLELTMAVPESEEIRKKLELTLITPLKEAGIRLTVVPVSMEALQESYVSGKNSGYDMLYLGENFSRVFDPELLKPREEDNGDSELVRARKEVYTLALDMVRTEPEDTDGFVRKWRGMQEKITETLPLLPVYSNLYFDFYTRELHQYDVTQGASWAEAVVRSCMSDMEELPAGERQRIRRELEEQFGK